MIINPDTTLLENTPFIASPNFDLRPSHTAINLLIIHNISLPPKQFGGPHIEALFCNQLDPDAHPYFKEIHTRKVSAHLLVRRDGSTIQFVRFSKRAWHAGESNFQGKSHCNDFSIGIELEGSDDVAYELAQYQQLSVLIPVIQRFYPEITADKIVGHCDVAPERKTDPGSAFEWPYLRKLLNQGTHGLPEQSA